MDRSRHQTRPGREPRGLPAALTQPLGPQRCRRTTPEPGLRVPLPDGPFLLGGSRAGSACMGRATPVVGTPASRGMARHAPAVGPAGRRWASLPPDGGLRLRPGTANVHGAPASRGRPARWGAPSCAALWSRRPLSRCGQRRGVLGGPHPSGVVDPDTQRPSSMASLGLVDVFGGTGLHLVDRAAAPAEPLQPSLPRLDRRCAGDDLERQPAGGIAGNDPVDRLPGRSEQRGLAGRLGHGRRPQRHSLRHGPWRHRLGRPRHLGPGLRAELSFSAWSV